MDAASSTRAGRQNMIRPSPPFSSRTCFLTLYPARVHRRGRHRLRLSKSRLRPARWSKRCLPNYLLFPIAIDQLSPQFRVSRVLRRDGGQIHRLGRIRRFSLRWALPRSASGLSRPAWRGKAATRLRIGAVVGPAMFMLGAAGWHVYQMIAAHNFSPGNVEAWCSGWTSSTPLTGFLLLMAGAVKSTPQPTLQIGHGCSGPRARSPLAPAL